MPIVGSFLAKCFTKFIIVWISFARLFFTSSLSLGHHLVFRLDNASNNNIFQVHSSSQRKELFKLVQEHLNEKIPSLLIMSQHTDNAQQAFSPDVTLSLHTTLLTIEEMYVKWEQASQKEHYKPFKDALITVMEKLNVYFQQTADSDAHIIAMGM